VGDVLFWVLLATAVAVVALDAARSRRSWQLVACGLGFVAVAFATVLTVWAALGALPLLAFAAAFLHGSRPRRTQALPRQREALPTPEPASNLRVL
jgi:hypothetical protein